MACGIVPTGAFVADASIILYKPPVAVAVLLTELSKVTAIERFLPGSCLELSGSKAVGRSLAVLRVRLGLMFLAAVWLAVELLCRGAGF
jgi:hypothetical protein